MTDPETATRAIVNILSTGDLARISSAVAQDYVDHQGLDDIEIRGTDGFRHVVKAVHSYSDVRVTIEDMVAAGDTAAVRLRWYGVDPAGQAVVRETLDLLRFADGLLVEHWGAQLFLRES